MIDAGLRYQGLSSPFADAVRWPATTRSHCGRSRAGGARVGAGSRGTTQVLCAGAQRRWLCLEPDADLVARIDERRRAGELPACCESRVGTLSAMARTERFDTVLYVDVLEHIEDDRGELAQAALLLNPGGHLIVLAPAHTWLWSPFDVAVGHHRRYTRASLLALGPDRTRVVSARYLDAVGLLASLGNRWVLRSALPTAAQIRAWDRFMVPLSRIVDPLLGYAAGKTVVAVWQRD